VSLFISNVSKLILHLKAFSNASGISDISFSVKVSNVHLDAVSELESNHVNSLFTFFHNEYIE